MSSDLVYVVRVLYEIHNQLRTQGARHTFLTLEQLETAAANINRPLTSFSTSQLLDILKAGVRQGAILQCTLGGTEITGSPVFSYSYNPDMLRVNYSQNAKLLRDMAGNGSCVHCYLYALQPNVKTTSYSSLCDTCPSVRGTAITESGVYSALCLDHVRDPIPDYVIATLQKCCK